jgi:multidrug efflux system membrane fusion protein
VRVADDKIKAEIVEAQAGVDQARLEFDRDAGLFEKESLTKPEYDSAKARLEVSQAKLSEARAQLKGNHATAARAAAVVDEVKLALKDCILVAPIDGVVLKKNVQEGSFVSAGTVAFTLADSTIVKVVFGVPDTELAKIRKGQLLNVTSEALPDQIFSGRVSEISPTADPRSRVFNVEVSVPNSRHLLKLGMVAALKVDGAGGSAKPSLSVPLTAVVRSSQNPDGYSVFIVENEGGKYTAKERPVQLGEAFGQKIVVVDGIKSGDTVVTAGSTRIANGEEVRVLN